MASRKKLQEDRLYAQISKLRQKLVLTDSEEESQQYLDQIAEIKEEIRKLDRKAPVVVPVKNAATVGDRIERRLKTGKKQPSTYTRSRVRL